MKEMQEKLSVWADLYQQCQKMEPLVRAARDLHKFKGGPPPVKLEAEYTDLLSRTDAAFKRASEALKNKDMSGKAAGP